MFRLEVEDTGIGIAPSDIGRLFVEFQQLDAGVTKKHSGTGLGLGLGGAKRLSSEFSIRSELGKGTCVVITRWKG